MIKEGLEALKHLCEQCHKNIQAQPSKGDLPHKECPWRHISNDYCDEYETVRKNLIRLEELEKAFDSLSKDDEKAKKELSKEIEKNRALEILKTRVIDMHDFLVYDTYSSFNQRRTLRGLTPVPKEDYDLLKEAML